jgi:hypothetical protein
MDVDGGDLPTAMEEEDMGGGHDDPNAQSDASPGMDSEGGDRPDPLFTLQDWIAAAKPLLEPRFGAVSDEAMAVLLHQLQMLGPCTRGEEKESGGEEGEVDHRTLHEALGVGYDLTARESLLMKVWEFRCDAKLSDRKTNALLKLIGDVNAYQCVPPDLRIPRDGRKLKADVTYIKQKMEEQLSVSTQVPLQWEQIANPGVPHDEDARLVKLTFNLAKYLREPDLYGREHRLPEGSKATVTAWYV